MKDEKRPELKDEKLEKVTGGIDTEVCQNGKEPKSVQRSENCANFLQGSLTGSGSLENPEHPTVYIQGLETIGPYPGGVCGENDGK